MEHPARIGKYEIEEYLGGGMSRVYRATDQVLRRTVALKLLAEKSAADGEAKVRFLREARTACSIVHENIVAVHDYGEEDGMPFIVMEYVEGDRLSDLIRNERTKDLSWKMRIASQLARALDYIHARKISHRDVKPGNVHVTADGHVKLMDFGIAKAEGMTLTRSGFTLGTPYYMAPEQVLGEDVTTSADVYAFGVLMYELFTSHRLVRGKQHVEVFEEILKGPVPREPLREAQVPDAVVRFMLHCLKKTPAERPTQLYSVCEEIAQQYGVRLSETDPAMKVPVRKARAPQKSQKAPGALPGILAMLPGPLQTETGLAVIGAASVFVVAAIVMLVLRTAGVL